MERLELRPGGAFVTRMSDDGSVFTDASDSTWRPASPTFFHRGGLVLVREASPCGLSAWP